MFISSFHFFLSCTSSFSSSRSSFIFNIIPRVVYFAKSSSSFCGTFIRGLHLNRPDLHSMKKKFIDFCAGVSLWRRSVCPNNFHLSSKIFSDSTSSLLSRYTMLFLMVTRYLTFTPRHLQIPGWHPAGSVLSHGEEDLFSLEWQSS